MLFSLHTIRICQIIYCSRAIFDKTSVPQRYRRGVHGCYFGRTVNTKKVLAHCMCLWCTSLMWIICEHTFYRLENVCEIGNYVSPLPLLIDSNVNACGKPRNEATLSLENGALRITLMENLKKIQETCEMLGTSYWVLIAPQITLLPFHCPRDSRFSKENVISSKEFCLPNCNDSIISTYDSNSIYCDAEHYRNSNWAESVAH